MGRQYSGYIQRSPDDRDHSKEHQQKAQADEEKPMQGARHEAVPFKASGEIVQRKPADDKKLPTDSSNDSSLGIDEKILVDSDAIGTVGDCTDWYMVRIAFLERQIAEFSEASTAPPKSLTTALKIARMQTAGIKKINGQMMPDLQMEALLQWNDDVYKPALSEADSAIDSIVLGRIYKTQQQVEATKNDLQKIDPQLRDLQRSAFRKGDDDLLQQIADTYFLYHDSLLVASEWVKEATTVSKEIGFLGTTLREQKILHGEKFPVRIEDTMVLSRNARIVKVLDIAEKVNQAYAAFQLVSGALDLMGGSKTASDKGSKGISYATTIASAGGTLLGASAMFSLYNNFYIGPMTGKILAQLEVLKDMISTGQNHPLIQMGKLDWVNWDIEPGGRKMFDYMMLVMKASSSDQIRKPTGDVLEYFDDNRGDFDAGAMGKDDIPTESSWIFWSEVDASNAKYWIYQHRQDIWGMLYGSLPVPR